jgi:aldehyde dehydrogenase (NAD+)
MRSGAVCVNDVIAPFGHPATPFGGHGASGWGVTQGMAGLLEMTVPQHFSFVRGRFRPNFNWHGPSRLIGPESVAALIDVAHAASIRTRFAAGYRFLRQLLGGRRSSHENAGNESEHY